LDAGIVATIHFITVFRHLVRLYGIYGNLCVLFYVWIFLRGQMAWKYMAVDATKILSTKRCYLCMSAAAAVDPLQRGYIRLVGLATIKTVAIHMR
jgi:hypothetical protein